MFEGVGVVVSGHCPTCKPVFIDFLDLEAKERVMEDMRLALTEQEETQSQMEEVLEERLQLIQELSSGESQDLKLRVRMEAKQTT